MIEYTIYFELFSKKMKTKVWANNRQEAKEKVKDSIIFYDVPKKKEQVEIFDSLKSIFNM